ncbi:bifunctional 4-hydroxy-3-methylbut-2-enyl diphosphate reductase/30S ribosomal protein S1 [Clostridium oceanicum]|uniref:4-hydroxy-3-methylbut-2-enyl diphosphate reductase n=1 Tax=Clostridium oceanicum TaxID=1543 RepID=A0ABP3UV93_9CLOT
MSVTLADKAGFCFGVKRAVEESLKTKKDYKDVIYTLGPLIHNNDVVNSLKNKGISPIDMEKVHTLKKGDTIIIRSHGVPLNTITTLKDQEFNIINNTCPHVSNIQNKARKYYKLGYSIVIVGDENHPEVIGINGWCNNSAIISKDGLNLENLKGKTCVLCQTTEKQENWEKVLKAVHKKTEDVIAFNTICNATSVRQEAARKLAEDSDVMIVIGGKNSSNTTKLYEICKEYCNNTFHVENASEIPCNIIDKGDIKIGVTAGASTPDWIIKEAILKMKNEENNEILDYMNKNDNNIRTGKIIKGTVISLNENEAYIDLNYKSEGVLPLTEVILETKEESSNIKDIYNVGDEITAKVIKVKNEDGYVVLSRTELKREKAYNELKEVFEDKKTIEVTIKESVKGGLVATHKGVRVFIPASHIELFHVDDLSKYEGMKVEVNIIEFIKQRNKTKIVGSRRALLKIEQDKKKAEAWDLIKEGDTVEGEVKRLTSFGAFVDINGIDGLLHISEISWKKIKHPSEALNIGDKIKVYVLSVDKEKEKLALSLKKLKENPWNNVEEKYPEGSIVLGKVVSIMDFGAFIELEPGVDGLVHISKLSNKKVENVHEVLNIGEDVKAKILNVNEKERRISLSIKDLEQF